MTVIAWDGRTLAADKQSTSHGMKRTTTKIYRVDDGLLALTGDGGHANALLIWFRGQRDRAAWPRAATEDCAGHVIHFSETGVVIYNGAGCGVGESVEDAFIAFGSGRDYAMAAMHLGCDARRAVEVACVFETSCGMGIDVLTLDQQ
jgi:ATP-dependent protease HslVU (ClpYQ) peptidase subunit